MGVVLAQELELLAPPRFGELQLLIVLGGTPNKRFVSESWVPTTRK